MRSKHLRERAAYRLAKALSTAKQGSRAFVCSALSRHPGQRLGHQGKPLPIVKRDMARGLLFRQLFGRLEIAPPPGRLGNVVQQVATEPHLTRGPAQREGFFTNFHDTLEVASRE